MRERQIISRGIILNVTDYSDTSLILQVFAEELGLISIIAKGAKREKRQDMGFYSLMNILEFTLLSQQSDMYVLHSSNLLESLAMTGRFEAFSLQCAGIELYRAMIVSHEEAPEYYELLHSYLTFLPKVSKNGILIFWRFLLRVFYKLGIGLEVGYCSHCLIETKQITHYNSQRSGFLCRDCTLELHEPCIPLEPHVAYILQSLPHIGHKLDEIEMTKAEISEIQSIFLRHFEDHMHQTLYFNSLKAL